MSWSNLIKKGEDTAFRIHAFDPDALDPSYDEDTSSREVREGALVLPAGPSGTRSSRNGREETESPEEKLARLEREAYEKGFEQGRKDGFALEEKQIEEQRQQMEALFSEIHGLKTTLFREAEEEAVTLSRRIARRIVRREIETDPGVIHRSVRAALDFVADRSRLAISIHPEDMEEVRKILPELASMTDGGSFKVVEDASVERGGCLLETGFGRINATVSNQLDVIDKVILESFVDDEEDAP